MVPQKHSHGSMQAMITLAGSDRKTHPWSAGASTAVNSTTPPLRAPTSKLPPVRVMSADCETTARVYCWGDNEAGQTALPDDLAADDCADANDTVCVIAAGGAARGRTDGSDDVDWFAVELDPGMEYTVYVAGSSRRRCRDRPLDCRYARFVGCCDRGYIRYRFGVDDRQLPGVRAQRSCDQHVSTLRSDPKTEVSATIGCGYCRSMPGADVSESTSRDLPDNAGTSGHVTRGGAARGSIDVRAQGHDEDAFAVALETGTDLLDRRARLSAPHRRDCVAAH